MFSKPYRKVDITAPPANLRVDHPPPALLLQQPTAAGTDALRGDHHGNLVQPHSKYDTVKSVKKDDNKKKKFSLFKKKKDKHHHGHGDDMMKRATRTPDVSSRKQLDLNQPDSAPLVRRPHSSASDRIDALQRAGSQRSFNKSNDFLNHLDDEDVDIPVKSSQSDYPRFTKLHPLTGKDDSPPYDSLSKYAPSNRLPDDESGDQPFLRTRSAHYRPAPPPPTQPRPSPTSPATPPRLPPPPSASPQRLPPLPGLVGIKNHGNTCYINTVIQCLSHSELFLHFILSGKCQKLISAAREKKYLTASNGGQVSIPSRWRPDESAAVLEYLSVLVKSLWNGQYEAKISIVFKEVIGLWAEQYRGRNQHDAQEFLLWLLGYAHDNLLSPKPSQETTNGVSATTNSIIYDQFGGEYQSCLHCPECDNNSYTFDPFLCASLSVPRRGTRPVYITMARRYQNSTKLMLFGLSVKVTATVRDIQRQLALESHTLPHYLVIGEMSTDGFHHFYHSGDPVAAINDTSQLYAFEVTPYKGDFMPSVPRPDQRLSETIFIILQNTVGQGEYSKRFSSPLCLRIWRDFTYSQLQSVVFKGIRKYIQDGINSESVCRDYIFFKCRVIDGLQGQEYLDPYSPSPLHSPSVEKALSLSKMWGYEPHIKLIAEWEQWVKDCVCIDIPEVDPPIHESAYIVKEHYDVPLEASLDDCLTWHTQEERLEGDQSWTCPKCTRPQNGAVKRITFYTLPDILVIHLKRFEQDEYSQAKLNSFIKFPINGLDMTPYISKADATTSRSHSSMAAYQTSKQQGPAAGPGDKTNSLPNNNKAVHFQDVKKSSKSSSKKFFIFKKGKKSKKDSTNAQDDSSSVGILNNNNRNQEDNIYDLYAVCNHHGDMTRGHYIAQCLNPINNKWFIYDDHHVLPVNNDGALVTQNAYILFYMRRNSKQKWLKQLSQSVGNTPVKSSLHWIQQLTSQYQLDLLQLPSIDHQTLFSPQRQGSVTSAHTLSTASGVSPDNVFFPSHLPQLPAELATPAPYHIRDMSTSSSGAPLSPQSTLMYPRSSASVVSTPAYISNQLITRRGTSFHSKQRHHSESAHSSTQV